MPCLGQWRLSTARDRKYTLLSQPLQRKQSTVRGRAGKNYRRETDSSILFFFFLLLFKVDLTTSRHKKSRASVTRFGRIFASWTIFCFSQFIENYASIPNVWAILFNGKIFELIPTKKSIGPHFGRFSLNLIWSHCWKLKKLSPVEHRWEENLHKRLTFAMLRVSNRVARFSNQKSRFG
jgi:hypothetical protein